MSKKLNFWVALIDLMIWMVLILSVAYPLVMASPDTNVLIQVFRLILVIGGSIYAIRSVRKMVRIVKERRHEKQKD